MANYNYLRYVLKVIVWEIAITAVFAVIISFLFTNYVWRLNFEQFLQALVNLNAGVIIAIFLAVFNSSNKNIENFRKFTAASRQLYIIILINCALVCVSTIFVNNLDKFEPSLQLTANITVGFLATIASTKNLQLVYKILAVYFRG
jgi:hypothetical protein